MKKSGVPGRSGREQFQVFFVCTNGQSADALFHEIAQIEADGVEFHPPGFDLREVEDVVDHGEHQIGGELDGLNVVALQRIETGVENQIGHADDAVHGCPDLMAHIGQELALGTARGLGPVTFGEQFGGAGGDLEFEAVTVSKEFQVAAFNLGEHAVEDVGKLAEIVIGEFDGPSRIVLFRGDHFRGVSEVCDRRQDNAL
jgi:hypothetical protein